MQDPKSTNGTAPRLTPTSRAEVVDLFGRSSPMVKWTTKRPLRRPTAPIQLPCRENQSTDDGVLGPVGPLVWRTSSHSPRRPAVGPRYKPTRAMWKKKVKNANSKSRPRFVYHRSVAWLPPPPVTAVSAVAGNSSSSRPVVIKLRKSHVRRRGRGLLCTVAKSETVGVRKQTRGGPGCGTSGQMSSVC